MSVDFVVAQWNVFFPKEDRILFEISFEHATHETCWTHMT